MNKKINKYIFTILLMFYIFSIPISAHAELEISEAEYTKEYQNWLNLSDEEKNNTIIPRKYYVTNTFNQNDNLLFSLNLLKASLNSTFSLQDVIPDALPVKNQYNTMSCWAFTSLTSLETNLALSNYKNSVNPSKTYNFSEKHMEYATSRVFLNNQINEKGYSRSANSCGNWNMAESYLTNGQGAINEEDMPFDGNFNSISLDEINNKTVTSQVYDTIAFENYQELSGTNATTVKNQIKEHIQNYGSVFASIHSSVDQENDKCFNLTTYSKYCNDSSTHKMDHAISIIGWDDNYSITNFTEGLRPSSNGAWIAKNSWGNALGNDDIFYISYEDCNVSQNMYGIIKSSDTVDYDNIYQYNYTSSFCDITIGTNKLVLSTLFDRTVSEPEYLKSISIYSPQTSTCKVYVNPTEAVLSNDSMELVQLVSGTTETFNAGYHTLEFASPIQLTGEGFAVSVEISSDSTVNVAIETKSSSVELIQDIETVTGKCFISESMDLSENSLYDLGTINDLNSNVPNGDSTIKAFTTIGSYDNSLIDIEISTPPTKITYTEGENFDKTGMVVKAHYNSQDNAYVTLNDSDYSITNGTNLKLNQTSVTISYEDKSVNQSITVLPKEEEKYTVTYNYAENGGTGTTKATDSVSSGELVDLTATATKEGYTFIGWNTNKSATTALSSLTVADSNITLYAIFKKGITINFVDYQNTVTKNITIYNNNLGEIQTPEIHEYSGWTSKYWTTGTSSTASKSIDENVTLSNISEDEIYYARYSKTVTLSFRLNGGTGTVPEDISGTVDVNSANISNINMLQITIPTSSISRSGYTFLSWNTEADGTGTTCAVGSKIQIDSTVTLYAQWKENSAPVDDDDDDDDDSQDVEQEYTITYNYSKNGGSSVTQYSDKKSKGDSVDLSITASKNGYEFIGWNTNADAKTVLTSLKVSNSNIVLYAIYKKEITITFIDYNNKIKNTVNKKITIFNNDIGEIQTPSIHDYSDWTARYWTTTTTPDASKSADANSTLTNVTDNATYYARYTKLIALTFNLNGGTGETPETISGNIEVNSSNITNVKPLSITIPTKSISRENYKFLSWNSESNGAGTSCKPGSTVQIFENVTLFAQWEKIEEETPEEDDSEDKGDDEEQDNDDKQQDESEEQKEDDKKTDESEEQDDDDKQHDESEGQKDDDKETDESEGQEEKADDKKAVNSNISDLTCSIPEITSYLYSDSSKTDYHIIKVSLSKFTQITSNDSLTYYYYISANPNEKNITNWISIPKPNYSQNTLSFEINTKDITNYNSLEKEEKLYIYLKELATFGGNQSYTISNSMKFEKTSSTKQETYLNGKIKNQESSTTDDNSNNNNTNTNQDSTTAVNILPKTGSTIIILALLISTSVTGIIIFIKYKKLNF